ncbi:MAG TPA: hypothetical protein ENI63_00730 [Candidatus Kaiserbacteria bacterium]|nr:hypothetical protein [Candidatus Kaiserbacteria bacterium]
MKNKKIKTILLSLGLVVGGNIPIFSAQPMTPSEYKSLLQMYTYEVQQLCEVKIKGKCRVVLTSSQFKEQAKQMNAKIKLRPIKDNRYALNRDALIKKYEASTKKKSLVDVIIKRLK